MKIIIKPRGKGKTTDLINLCANNNYSLIVVHTQENARLVFEAAKRLKKHIPMPITYQEFIENRYSAQNVDTFLIDNVDMLLQRMTRVPIEAITLTEETRN